MPQPGLNFSHFKPFHYKNPTIRSLAQTTLSPSTLTSVANKQIPIRKMAMRSAISSRSPSLRHLTESSPAISRSGLLRLFSDKGRVLSEEEQAAENIYIRKMEKERLEKQKVKEAKEKEEKEKAGASEKKP